MEEFPKYASEWDISKFYDYEEGLVFKKYKDLL